MTKKLEDKEEIMDWDEVDNAPLQTPSCVYHTVQEIVDTIKPKKSYSTKRVSQKSPAQVSNYRGGITIH